MAYDREYYQANKAKAIERALAWRANNPEKYAEIQQRNQRAITKRLRDKVFENYGGAKCSCCGETTAAFLTIDHTEGGGNKHRKELGGSGSGERFYRWLRDNNYPPGFRVLCWNCNCGRNSNGGVCPHEQMKR